MNQPQPARLASAAAVEVAREACAAIGHRGEGAALIRLGENAIVRVDSPAVMVRVARGPDVLADAAKEVRVAQWLAEIGLQAARTVDVAQPIVIRGHPVTFWQLVPDSGAKASAAELGYALRDLHAEPVPDWLELPALDLFGRVGERIARSSDISETDREFLTNRLGELRQAAAELEYASPLVAVHGDAHVQNLICDPEGFSLGLRIPVFGASVVFRSGRNLSTFLGHQLVAVSCSSWLASMVGGGWLIQTWAGSCGALGQYR